MLFSISKSQKGSEVLCLNGRQYLFKRKSGDSKIWWRCRQYWKYKCKSTLVTENERIVQASTEHSHPGDPVAVMADKFRAQLREVASTTIPPLVTLLDSR